MKSLLTLILLESLLIVSACQAPSNPNPQPSSQPSATATPASIATTTLFESTGSSSSVKETLLISDQAAFAQLWTRLSGPQGSPPAIDFSKQSLIAVSSGAQPSSGYSVRIKSITSSGPTLTVHYQELGLSPGMGGYDVITYPWHLVSIPLSKTQSDFSEVRFVLDP